MQLWQYYRILRKYQLLILIGTVICVGTVGLFAYLSPSRWEASTTILDKSMKGKDISLFAQQYMQSALDPRFRMSSIGTLITSRTVLERSAETLWRLNITADPVEILRTLDVTPVEDSGLIRIRVESDSPKTAKATTDVVTAEFIRFYNELNSSNAYSTRDFIKKNLPRAKDQLSKTQEALRKFEESDNAIMLPSQTQLHLQEMSQYQTALSGQDVAAKQAAARVQGLEKQLKDTPGIRVASTVIASNPVWQSLQSELMQREIDMQTMLKDRTPEHPDVKALAKRIDETQKRMQQVGSSILNSTTKAADPTHDAMFQQYVGSMIDNASANAAKSAIQAQVANLGNELNTLPKKEMKLAQLTLDAESAKNTYVLLAQKMDEATLKVQESKNDSDIQVVDQSVVLPVSNRGVLKILLALILSPILCGGIAFLLEYLDNTIKTPKDAEKLLGIPVFGAIPFAKSHMLSDSKVPASLGISYDMLSTNLDLDKPALHGNSILVASSEPNVGRSVTAANLAIKMASDGMSVILVDSDLRMPVQHALFGVENDKGLTNVLAGQLPLKDAFIKTSNPDLRLLTSGPLPGNPIRLLRSESMAKLVNEIGDLADIVIFDSPSGIVFADSVLLASLIKNVLVVYAAGSVPRGTEAEFASQLQRVDANVLGSVLNGVEPKISHGSYHFRNAYKDFMPNGKSKAALTASSAGQIQADAKGKDNGTDGSRGNLS